MYAVRDSVVNIFQDSSEHPHNAPGRSLQHQYAHRFPLLMFSCRHSGISIQNPVDFYPGIICFHSGMGIAWDIQFWKIGLPFTLMPDVEDTDLQYRWRTYGITPKVILQCSFCIVEPIESGTGVPAAGIMLRIFFQPADAPVDAFYQCLFPVVFKNFVVIQRNQSQNGTKIRMEWFFI